MDVKLGQLVRFDTISPAILGDSVKGVVQSILPFDKASMFSADDLATKNTLVYESIGETVKPELKNMTFLEIRLISNGEVIYFAEDWIAPGTFMELENIVETIFTFSNLTTEQLGKIKAFLALNGITEYSVS